MNLLEFHAVSYVLPNNRYILRDINASFRSKELTLILGPNGSGKTVLARHALALTQPSSGYISIKGEKLNKHSLQTLRKNVGMVFQESERQFIGQTVEEEIQCGLENTVRKKEDIKEILESVLKTFSFQGRGTTHPLHLSGGEKRRLAIAAIYAMQPELLFIDEPFYALDYRGCKVVLQAILRLREQDRGVVVITHEYQHLLARADRVILLSKGKIRYDGPAEKSLPLLEPLGLQPPLIPLRKMSCV